ncbi:hypothetical protein [Acerihabitans arboris]|uniref:Uncharacterized protein n=1 Tax=Acerihabitans arboris TaxID=2691583 RepID=A0A845SSM4_9GAMM|nr:hypothetical protein [Acerihabitans arboris]NDL65924.1 hypothetical protein [Acerihabitans arboris]
MGNPAEKQEKQPVYAAQGKEDRRQGMPAQSEEYAGRRGPGPNRQGAAGCPGPSNNEQNAFQDQFLRRLPGLRRLPRLVRNEIELLQRYSIAVYSNDCDMLLRLLNRPSVDFIASLTYFTDYVHTLSNILNDRNVLGLAERDIKLITKKWTESARAFYCIRDRVSFDGDVYSEKLAAICHLWSHTQPVQSAGCAATASMLCEYRAKHGMPGLHYWLVTGTNDPGRDISLFVNAFSRWADEHVCKEAGIMLAGEVAARLAVPDSARQFTT